MPSLAGKVAIVTGGGRGLGRAHALALAAAGAGVVVNDRGGTSAGEGRDETPAQQVAKEIEAAGGQASANFDDVADFEGAANLVGQAVEDFGKLDILVNNAGIIRDRMLVNLTEDEWDAVIAVHLKGHYAPIRHAAAYWRGRAKAGEGVRGRVVNTSSPSGLFGNAGQANYGAAKAGIAALTVIAALELSRYGVTVNCIAPTARTRLTEQTFGDMAAPSRGFDALDPANVAPVVVALASDEAQGITGQCFFVYGGVVNVLKPWDSGAVFSKDSAWDADELVAKLAESYPNGLAPEGMMPMMVRATGGEGVRFG